MSVFQDQKTAIENPLNSVVEKSAHSHGHDMSRELARFLLTQTAEAIRSLNEPQQKTWNQLENNIIFARESNQYSSLSHFLATAVDIAFFASSFYLDTPVCKQIGERARQTVFDKS